MIWDLAVIIILSAMLATHLWIHRCCADRIRQLAVDEGAMGDEMYAAAVVGVNMNTADDTDTDNEDDDDGDDSDGDAMYGVKPTSIDPRLESAYLDCSLRSVHIRSVRSANLVAAAVCAVCVAGVCGMLAVSMVVSNVPPLAEWAVLAVLMPAVHFVPVLRDYLRM